MLSIFPYSSNNVLSAQQSELIGSLLAGNAVTKGSCGLPTAEALSRPASC